MRFYRNDIDDIVGILYVKDLLFYKNNSYLMLEAIVFAFLAITLIAGKKANR